MPGVGINSCVGNLNDVSVFGFGDYVVNVKVAFKFYVLAIGGECGSCGGFGSGELDACNDDVTHVSCCGGFAPTGVDEQVQESCFTGEFGGESFEYAGGDYHLLFNDLNCVNSFKFYSNVSGLDAVVAQGNAEEVIAVSLFLNPSVEVFIGVGRNLAVGNVNNVCIFSFANDVVNFQVTLKLYIFAIGGDFGHGNNRSGFFGSGFFGFFTANLRESHAGEGNVGVVSICGASCRVNEYYEVGNCATFGVFVIGDGESYALTCRNSNCGSTPFHIGPNVAANSCYVTNGVVANLVGCLNVYTNARIRCAIVGDGNNKGVIACRKSCDISACARVGVAGTVVLNVVAVCGVIRGGCPEVELQTCIGSNLRGFFGSCLFGNFRSGLFGNFRSGLFGSYGSGFFRLGFFGDVFTDEFHVGEGNVTCVSGTVIPLTAVNKNLEVGGVLGSIVVNNENRGCACFNYKGRSAPFEVGESRVAILCRRKVASGGVCVDLGSAFNIDTELDSFGAVVGNGNGESVLGGCDRGYGCPEVLVGVTYNIGVNNVNGIVFIVCVYAVTVGYVALEGDFGTVYGGGKVSGGGVFGCRGRSDGIFVFGRSYDLAKGCKLDLFNGNVTGTESCIVSGRVDHELEFFNNTVEFNNEFCSFACSDVEEGAAPNEVGVNNHTVHGSRNVGCHILCTCINQCLVNHVYTNVNELGAVVCNFEVNVVFACSCFGDIHFNRLVIAAAYVFVGDGSLVTFGGNNVFFCAGECGSNECAVCPVDVVIAYRRLFGRIEGSAFCAGSDPLILGTVIIGSALVFAHPSPSSFVATPVVGEHSTCGRGELFNDSNVFAGGCGLVGGYLVNGLAVNEPSDGIFCPTEAVGVEFLGSVKAKVVHIFIAALAVNEEVELNVSGIFAEELDIDFVVCVCNGYALTVIIKNVVAVFIQNELGVVGTCANKECACGTCVSRGLHANFVVTVVVVILGARFTCGVVELNFFIVEPSACFFLGDAKAHNAVFIEYVAALPNNVENVAVGPAVRLEQNRGVCAVCKIDYLLSIESCIGQGNLLGFVVGGAGSSVLRCGFFRLSEKSAKQIAQTAAAKRHYQCQCQCECYKKFLFHNFLLEVEK